MNQGHTSRGSSGSLYSKSATARVDPRFEGVYCVVCAIRNVLTNGSCAIGGCEPCQVGNQAALSSSADAPRGSLFRAGNYGVVRNNRSNFGCMVLICELFFVRVFKKDQLISLIWLVGLSYSLLLQPSLHIQSISAMRGAPKRCRRRHQPRFDGVELASSL